jgi:glycosyltransferase involved in cell wall biosynthesis
MVLQRILQGARDDFDRVVVFASSLSEPLMHEGIEARPYTRRALRSFALRERPSVYFPNMVHNAITRSNLGFVSRFSRRTVVNMIGGYPAGTPLGFRRRTLRKVRRHADVAVHVDPCSTEWLIDQAVMPGLPVRFITQGIDHDELDAVRQPPDAEPYVVHAHNLWHWKGADVVLRELAARLPALRFKVIASDTTGDAIDEVRRIADPLPNVEMRLGRPREEFLATMAGAQAVVSASTVEGAQPNIMLEAGYLGVPYLSLCPGQNYGHYPHVEMYATIDTLRKRLDEAAGRLRDEKAPELERGRRHLGQDRYRWDDVVEQFRHLFRG